VILSYSQNSRKFHACENTVTCFTIYGIQGQKLKRAWAVSETSHILLNCETRINRYQKRTCINTI